MSSVRFKSFSSGSSGNCYFIGIFNEIRHCEAGILIDAGVSLRRLRKELEAEGLNYDDIHAILITHDHNDHIRSLGSYCKKLQKPVWLTPRLKRSLSVHWLTGEYLSGVVRELSYSEWNEIVPGAVRARCFVVPHDATETLGFCLDLNGTIYVHITDIGEMTEEALEFCSKASSITIESNYDPEMLENGPYPEDLKARIRSGHGHLGNPDCAEAISSFANGNTRNIFLCHLSEHNNTPLLAVETSRPAVAGKGIRLLALPRTSASPFFEL